MSVFAGSHGALRTSEGSYSLTDMTQFAERFTVFFLKSLAIKSPEKSIWERELAKLKTVRYGYTVVANMIFVQGRTSGKILTNNL